MSFNRTICKQSQFSDTAQKKSSFGLVFAGGGGKGAYQIGVWAALRDLGIDMQITHVAGTSVGGLNAALFALRDFPSAELVWRGINQDTILSINPEKLLTFITKLITETFVTGIPVMLLKKLTTMLANMRTEGVFSREGLMQVIDNHVNLSGVSLSDISLYLTCWNKRTHKPEYFRANNQSINMIRQLLLATSAIPGVFPSEKIYGEHYYDGGLPFVGDNVPIKPLYDIGVRKMIVVHLDSDTIIQKDCFPDAELYEIVPQKELGGFFSGMLNFSPHAIDEKIRQGYEETLRVLLPVYKTARIQHHKAELLQRLQQDEAIFTQKKIEMQRNIQTIKHTIQNKKNAFEKLMNDGL